MSPQNFCTRRFIIAFVDFQTCPQITCLWGSKVALFAFVCLFSNVLFQMPPQITCLRECIVAMVAFFLAFLHCAFWNECSNRLPESIHSHTGCIYLTFLHCALSNVSANCLPQRVHCCNGCIFYRTQVSLVRSMGLVLWNSLSQLCKLNWFASSWWRYKLNTNW